MWIKEVKIKNFRLFDSNHEFEINNIGIPNGENVGSGLTVFVGENGCGKTSLLDAIALPILTYKTETFSINDFNNPDLKATVKLYSDKTFTVKGTMPKNTFNSKGFLFEAGVRSRTTKAYLSSIVVSDQKYIKADGEGKPADTSPDLRVNVNNPFSGKRFDENDVVFLDRNRTFQIRSGTYNSTRFDRLMEDFNFQYIKNQESVSDLNDNLYKALQCDVGNEFLSNAMKKFKELSQSDIQLNLINNIRPFSKGFFAEKKENNLQVSISDLGSGYEMIFSLLYSFYLARQSGKQLIVIIDEPELHLHPTLQEKFVGFLLELSKESQVILATHSPLFIKQLMSNENAKILIMKNDEKLELTAMDSGVLPYVSSNEINYLAFNLVSEEYHNELYEELKHLTAEDKTIKNFDKNFFQKEKGEPSDSLWKGNANEVSYHTFLRNQIHHQKENGKADPKKLNKSIQSMIEYLKEIN